MAENEGMEGKDLAQKEKKDFENKLLEVIENLKNGHTTISTEGLEVTNFGGQFILKMRGINFGIVSEEGKFSYNKANFIKLKQTLQEEGVTLEQLGLPDLEQSIDQEEKEQKEEQEQENEENNEGEEIEEEEKDDEKPDLEEEKKEEKDEKKEEIAKQYGINSSQVIHISKNKKITDKNFGQIAEWTRNYEDIYIVPGEDEYSRKFIGVSDGKQQEIEEAQKQIGGKSPDITVKRIDGEQITQVKPISMYELDDKTAIAIVKDQYGRPEALYCRQEGGDKKTFWGSIIPEADGKNVMQQGPETREFIDYKNNSNNDLAKKADALSRQQDLEQRGAPSKKEGVQVKEIEGSAEQNRKLNIEDIVKELMSRDGVVDKLTVPPNYYENKAEKVLYIMENEENITYEEAVEKARGKGTREEGGRTPGETRNKREE